MKVNERKQQQIKIAHILKDLGLEDDLIEKMTSLKKEEFLNEQFVKMAPLKFTFINFTLLKIAL